MRRYPWRPDKPNARIWLLLARRGPLEVWQICERLADLDQRTVSDALNDMKVRPEPLVERDPATSRWKLIPGALPPPIRGLDTVTEMAAAQGPAIDLADVGQRADVLICRHPHGLDSAALAHDLGVPAEAVDAALAPAVAQHRFITCKVVREGREGVLYRLSAGFTPPFDWKKQCAVTWDARLQRNAREAVVPAAAAPAPEPVHAAVAAPVAAASPEAAPAQTVDVADADLHPAAPPSVRLSVVGELDIDAIHRRQGTPQPASSVPFRCALWSTGELVLCQGGQEMRLPVAHTRMLLHYLDQLPGETGLEESAA
jgi:hypothetical protein